MSQDYDDRHHDPDVITQEKIEDLDAKVQRLEAEVDQLFIDDITGSPYYFIGPWR